MINYSISLGARLGTAQDNAQNQGKEARCRVRGLQQFVPLLHDLQRPPWEAIKMAARTISSPNTTRSLRIILWTSAGHYKEQYGIEFKTLEPFWRVGHRLLVSERLAGRLPLRLFLSDCFPPHPPAPILQESGLSTVISASDETSVAHSIEAFQAYMQAGVLPLVGRVEHPHLSGRQ